MQSAATIYRLRSPIAIRALNRFGAMLNGKVSRRIPPEELIETARRRANLNDFGNGDFREPLGRLLESCWRRSIGFALLFLWWDCRGLAQRFCILCSPLIRRIARR